MALADEVFEFALHISDSDSSEDVPAPHTQDLSEANRLLQRFPTARGEASVIVGCDSTKGESDPAPSGPVAGPSGWIPYNPEDWHPDSPGSSASDHAEGPAAKVPRMDVDLVRGGEQENEERDDVGPPLLDVQGRQAAGSLGAPNDGPLPGMASFFQVGNASVNPGSVSAPEVSARRSRARSRPGPICFKCLKVGHDRLACPMVAGSGGDVPRPGWPLRCPACNGYIFRGHCFTCAQL